MKKHNEQCSTPGSTNPEGRKRGEAKSLILESVTKLQCATAMAVSRDTGIPVKSVTSIIGRMSISGRNQKLRLVDYEQEADGLRDYPRPVFSLGVGPPAEKPAPVPRQMLKNKYWRAAKMRTVSSVFDLGVPVRLRLKGQRAGSRSP